MTEQLKSLYDLANQALQIVREELLPNAATQSELARGLQIEIELNRVAAILSQLLPEEGAS